MFAEKKSLAVKNIFVAVCVLGIAGCSLNNSNRAPLDTELNDFEQQKVSIDLVNDIPIPNGAKLDTTHSLILGRGDRWTGRIVMNTSILPARVFALFQSQMPSFGWQTVLSVQDKSSNIVFIRGDRIATLTISPLGLRGSRVVMVASLSPVTVPSAGTFNAAPNNATDIGAGISTTVPLQ